MTGSDVTVIAADYFQSYSVVGLLAVVGVLFVAVAFGAGRLLRPVVPTPERGTRLLPRPEDRPGGLSARVSTRSQGVTGCLRCL